MKMLELDSKSLFGTEGSGNQKKLWVGNTLIKIDSKHRESKKEVSASVLGEAFGLSVVQYTRERFILSGREHWGCYCNSYLKQNERVITAYKILNYFDVNIPQKMSAREYFEIFINCVHNYTGLDKKHIKMYMLSMLVFDYIIANPDRHLSNIEFIQGEGYFRFTPLYDHGQSFFGKDSELTLRELRDKSRKFKTMPFSRNPLSNLIDIEVAKKIAVKFEENAIKKYGSLSNIPITEPHLKVVKFRLDLLKNGGKVL